MSKSSPVSNGMHGGTQTKGARSVPLHLPQQSFIHDIGLPGTTPHRRSEHELLSACIGTWKVEGTLADNATRMRCTETYEWLPGKFFVAYKFERQIGAQQHKGTGIIGFDPKRGGHFAYFVDNMGFARMYDLGIDEKKWTLTGTWERALLTFNAKINHMSAHWEHSNDGASWRVLCDFEGRLEQQNGNAAHAS